MSIRPSNGSKHQKTAMNIGGWVERDERRPFSFSLVKTAKRHSLRLCPSQQCLYFTLVSISPKELDQRYREDVSLADVLFLAVFPDQ